MSEEQGKNYISVKKAGEVLGIDRSSMYYYFKKLGIKPQKFEIGRKTYITRAELEQVRAAKELADADER